MTPIRRGEKVPSNKEFTKSVMDYCKRKGITIKDARDGYKRTKT